VELTRFSVFWDAVLFHLDSFLPNSNKAFTIHFLLHGVHHYRMSSLPAPCRDLHIGHLLTALPLSSSSISSSSNGSLPTGHATHHVLHPPAPHDDPCPRCHLLGRQRGSLGCDQRSVPWLFVPLVFFAFFLFLRIMLNSSQCGC
jgi:hypothetical protein